MQKDQNNFPITPLIINYFKSVVHVKPEMYYTIIFTLAIILFNAVKIVHDLIYLVCLREKVLDLVQPMELFVLLKDSV